MLIDKFLEKLKIDFFDLVTTCAILLVFVAISLEITSSKTLRVFLLYSAILFSIFSLLFHDFLKKSDKKNLIISIVYISVFFALKSLLSPRVASLNFVFENLRELLITFHNGTNILLAILYGVSLFYLNILLRHSISISRLITKDKPRSSKEIKFEKGNYDKKKLIYEIFDLIGKDKPDEAIEKLQMYLTIIERQDLLKELKVISGNLTRAKNQYRLGILNDSAIFNRINLNLLDLVDRIQREVI